MTTEFACSFCGGSIRRTGRSYAENPVCSRCQPERLQLCLAKWREEGRPKTKVVLEGNWLRVRRVANAMPKP